MKFYCLLKERTELKEKLSQRFTKDQIKQLNKFAKDIANILFYNENVGVTYLFNIKEDLIEQYVDCLIDYYIERLKIGLS